MSTSVFFDDAQFLKLGLSLDMVEAIKNIVLTDLGAYVALDRAGTPETFVKANFSRLCVDTVGNQMYFNPTVGATTGWVAV
jgi:hypothetical protein